MRSIISLKSCALVTASGLVLVGLACSQTSPSREMADKSDASVKSETHQVEILVKDAPEIAAPTTQETEQAPMAAGLNGGGGFGGVGGAGAMGAGGPGVGGGGIGGPGVGGADFGGAGLGGFGPGLPFAYPGAFGVIAPFPFWGGDDFGDGDGGVFNDDDGGDDDGGDDDGRNNQDNCQNNNNQCQKKKHKCNSRCNHNGNNDDDHDFNHDLLKKK